MAHYYSSSAILATIRFYLLFSLFVGMVSAQLSPFFHANTCPDALTTIKSAVDSQCQVNHAREHSCFRSDASAFFDDTTNFIGEKTASTNNNSLTGFDVVDTIKSQVENVCLGVVSCADILAVAARDSVVAVRKSSEFILFINFNLDHNIRTYIKILGGPSWPLLLGRRDSTTANLSDSNSDLPTPALNLSGLISAFSNKGFTAQEMVALSGEYCLKILHFFKVQSCTKETK
ncbi:cationic peroxidase 1 [Quercus suber]|uniref:peroxidase n=1 Tax=Quercus suber TaxID=58331 RepID=A0AAW0LSK2_QUESU